MKKEQPKEECEHKWGINKHCILCGVKLEDIYQGQLKESWEESFDNLKITYTGNGHTTASKPPIELFELKPQESALIKQFITTILAQQKNEIEQLERKKALSEWCDDRQEWKRKSTKNGKEMYDAGWRDGSEVESVRQEQEHKNKISEARGYTEGYAEGVTNGKKQGVREFKHKIVEWVDIKKIHKNATAPLIDEDWLKGKNKIEVHNEVLEDLIKFLNK